MSLNNITLPSQLVATLYHHSLVSDIARPVPQNPPLPFLGKAAKGILIVVNKANVAYLPDGELSFLTKVLMACQLGLSDVAIVNWHTSHGDAAAVLAQFSPRSVLLFDVSPTLFGMPVHLPPYAVYTAGEQKMVAAPSLSDIEASKETKGQLWLALKEIFDL